AVPGQYEPRTAHAAQRHHRGERDAAGGCGGSTAGRRTARPRACCRPPPPRTDKRHSRPFQDRGRADGVESRFLPVSTALKTERSGGKTYKRRDEARSDVFDYIDSTIGYLSPMEFEQRAGFA